MPAFSHSDGYVTITPLEGPNRGVDLVLHSVEKASFDPGGKASYLKGLALTPVAIVHGSAEPKLSYDTSAAGAAWLVRQHVGGIGGYPFTLSHVFRRPGRRTVAWKFAFCELENGAGFESDDSKGVGSKLEMKCLDAEQDGVSVYRERLPQ